MTQDLNAVFSIERYRTQWSHLPLVFLPFLCATALVLASMLLAPWIPKSASMALMAIAGTGFAVVVLTFPLLWKRWRRRGGLEIRLCDGVLHLVSPGTGESIGRCSATPGHVLPGEFHYTVNSRFAGGTYRAPAVTLILENGTRISVGIAGSPLAFRGNPPRIDRPDYSMDLSCFEDFCSLTGLSEALIPRTDARA